jgi:NhaP-type Na+/H+ or K+/H+ antiporter
MITGLAILSVLIVLYAALAVKLGHWSITMPMVFIAVGFVLGPGGAGLLAISPQAESVKMLTEITLALLLFADASTLKLEEVRDDAALSACLLTIGLPLTIVAGAGAALVLLPEEGLAFACLLGAILAPTDAALGLPIFNNPRVPVRIRRALNIESGLNDGIATPFVLLFLAFAAATEGTSGYGGWLITALIEIALAVLVGAIVGLIGGNGFIAAFTGGIVFRAVSRNRFIERTEFTETFGTFLSVLVWGIFGAVLVSVVLKNMTDWRPILYAILSLMVVRMAPVALALRGAGLRRDTVTLMGWFGPRGLASVVFTLLALERFQAISRAGGHPTCCGHLDDPVQRSGAWPVGHTAVNLVCAPA